MSKSLNEIISNVIISVFLSILIFNIPTVVVKVQAKDAKVINKEYASKDKFNNIFNISQCKSNISNFNKGIKNVNTNVFKNDNKKNNFKTHDEINIILDEIQNSIEIEKLEEDHILKKNNAKNQNGINKVKDNDYEKKQQLEKNKDNKFKVIFSILGAIIIGLTLVMIYEKRKEDKE
ncbi:hypothetical protein [Hathewaya limosa]|uniref:Lipopolysaccharide export LptBFGC system permease protein LptF n=1 Tax=Hathewaya limosa TaxID=1536 RepID=A0ABU0JX65_HATLI|nr:hypothetical protein [Hathewaya limosa]MDQ0480492.1 lipopolysaccharide export LptBFGC system permease protein LptF [Hathewaya limosa]